MVHELITALNRPTGFLIHKGHEVYCPNKHPIGVLNPIDGTDYIAIGNAYDESMFSLDTSQAGYDTTLACKICGATGVTL